MSLNITAKQLNPKQQKALAGLLTSPTIGTAASVADVHPRTIKRWLAEDELFVEEYRSLRQAAVDNAVAQLQAGMSEAVETLRENLDAGNPSVQVRAAVSLLELAFKAIQQQDVEARLKALEEAASEERTSSW